MFEYGQHYVTTSTKVQSITNKETANNESSFSERRRPNSAYRSHRPILIKKYLESRASSTGRSTLSGINLLFKGGSTQ
jgi:hypothetical protein